MLDKNKFDLRRANFVIVLILTLSAFACKKNNKIRTEGISLEFSCDTVFFDTVFTTLGTVTHRFTVSNPHDEIVEIEKIYLAGKNSPFRIAVDGSDENVIQHKQIAPNDSIYIFVEATIDPNNDSLPIVVSDSIIFETKGNIQDVNLMAWGQDVYLYKSKNWVTTLETDLWKADKPHLIYGYVHVKRNHTLTIEPGANIYFHRSASMVVEGTLEVRGTVENPVLFASDRLEELYDDVPSQWGTIAFIPSSNNNVIENATIKNAIVGLQVGLADNDTVVDIELANVTIANMSYAGIVAYGAQINAHNTLVYSGQTNAIRLIKGGEYNFYHLTAADGGYGSEEVLVMSNNIIDLETYDKESDETVKQNFYNNLTANFYNSIIYGNTKSEILLSDDDKADFNLGFEYCLLKADKDSINLYQTDEVIFNIEPKFMDIDEEDFSLDTLSPAINKASLDIVKKYIIKLEFDIIGENRTLDKNPDIGCYERQNK
ncbi:hypothetical protein OAO55_01305 [Bacteroidales bacterium]|nr:hypothetical protein [Bacteroidales bacterium]